MSLRRLGKATRLTLAIVGLSVIHSFSIGEWTIAASAWTEDSRTWLSNNPATGQVSKPEAKKMANNRTTANQTGHRLINQLSIRQLIATAP